MAIVGGQNASSSMSSQFPCVIFLSYRGKDTGKTFTDHLYTALISAGLSAFRDNDSIKRGENIKSQLQEAIMRSKIAIIVISKGYAASTWCLEELVLILQCMKTTGLIVLPVFYDVDPSHVRHQSKSFNKALVRHEGRFKSETDDRKRDWLMDRLTGWRKALTEVANLSGMVLKNEADGYESKFVQKVVTQINNKLSCNDFHVAPYLHLVGVDARAEPLNLWLRNGSEGVKFLEIVGMNGVGKSTIAKRVFNMNYRRFEYSSFLENVSQVLRKPNGLSRLQRKFHWDILKEKAEKMDSVPDGINKIKSAVRQGRVLIVFDDVNQEDLKVIYQMRGWFCSGSKIIITTRCHPQSHESCVRYEADLMSFDESLELFCWHAFRGCCSTRQEYLDLSYEFVEYCRGHPLALQISAASLRGQTIDVWKNKIGQLKSKHWYNLNLGYVLKSSLDSLSYHGKSLFLDIACFFCGMNETEAIIILDACYDSATVGIKELKDRCLLTVDNYNKIRMHALIHDMAMGICQESPVEFGKRSRLWGYVDSSQTLRGETGIENIEGLSLNTRRREYFTEPSNINNEDYNNNNINTRAFSRMKKLRLLEINYAQLTGDSKYFPDNLRWLSWYGSPLTSLTSLPLDNLISLNMKHSNLEKLWTGKKDLRSLKVLNLSHCHRLVEISDLSKVRALEKMVIKGCINLVEIDESIGFAEELSFLDLRDCTSLKKLPDSIARLKSLKLLTEGCSNLNMSTNKNDQLIPHKSNNVPPKISAIALHDRPLPVMEHIDVAENVVRNITTVGVEGLSQPSEKQILVHRVPRRSFFRELLPILRDHPMVANSTSAVGGSSTAVPIFHPPPTDEASTAERPDPKGKCAITIDDLKRAKEQSAVIKGTVELGNQQQAVIASEEEIATQLQAQVNAEFIPVIESTPPSLPFTNDELVQALAAEKELYKPATIAFDSPAGTSSSQVIDWEGFPITQKARPILERVKAMHPDFLSGFVVKHGPYQQMFLKDLANILTIVSSTKVKDMTPCLLDNLAEKMNDMMALGVDLKFLQNRLNDIRECSNLAALELGIIEDDLAIEKLEESVVQLKQQLVRHGEEIKSRRRTRAANAQVILQLKEKLGALDLQMLISQDLF